jgi:hypothetical protein
MPRRTKDPKNRTRHRKKSVKKFPGQVLKGEFEWGKAPFSVKAVCASVGLSESREALIFGIRIFALAQQTQIQYAGQTNPAISEFKPDYENFGSSLIASLVGKIFPSENILSPEDPCEKFLSKLGIVLDTLKKQNRREGKIDRLIWNYHRLRQNKFLPPTSKQIEEAYCRMGPAHRDSTSSIRKMVAKFGLRTLAIKDLKNLKNSKTRTSVARREILGDLSPLTWPLADFYEALVWKTCPDQIFDFLIVKNRIYRGLVSSGFFDLLSKTEDFKKEVYSLVDVIYDSSFELNDSLEIQSELGPISEYCRKWEQTNFFDLEKQSAFTSIRPEILQKFKYFVEESTLQEALIFL